MRPALQLLFFLSGATALVFELLWLRGFALVLGSTLRAMACVLTAFMLGLAVGGALAARSLRQRTIAPERAFLVYAVLELAIGVYGALFTPALFSRQESFIRLVAPAHALGGGIEIATDFVFSCLALAIPTIAMGATLPVLSAALTDDRETASLYGANLLGAACGSLASSFLVVNLLGCITGAYVTAAINVGIFGFACWLSRRNVASTRELPPPPERTSVDGWSPQKTLLLAFFSGFVFFESELVFNRFLSLFLGNRVYVTSVTLAVVLGCLALGARLVRWSLARAPFRQVCSTAYAIASSSTLLAVLIAPGALESRGLLRFLFVILLVPLPAIAAGMVFPILLTIAESHGDPASRVRHVGRLVAVNTLGSVAGTLLTSYVLIGSIGSLGTLLSGVLAMGASIWLLARDGPARLQRVAGPVILVLGCVLFFFRREVPVAAASDATVVRRDEDEHCLFLVQRFANGSLGVECTGTKLVNRFGTPSTQFVQETQAHVPLMFSPSTARALVIGSGYGITAGVFGLYAGVERVDAVEILPLMVRHADLFESANHGYLNNEKIVVHLTDGRHFLALSKQPYDLISINVTDPYLPGTASLYSEEFYSLVARHLAPGGIVCQHVFGPDAASLLHGFRAQFPHVTAIPSYAGAITLIGSPQPLVARRSPFDDPRGREALLAIGIDSQASLQRLLEQGNARIAALSRLPQEFVHRDAFPVLEFRRTSSVDTFRSNF